MHTNYCEIWQLATNKLLQYLCTVKWAWAPMFQLFIAFVYCLCNALILLPSGVLGLNNDSPTVTAFYSVMHYIATTSIMC